MCCPASRVLKTQHRALSAGVLGGSSGARNRSSRPHTELWIPDPLDSDDFAVQYTMPCNVRQQNDLPYVLGALKINESPSGRGKITRIFGPTSTVTVLNLILDLIAQSNSSHSHGLAVESQKRPHTDVLEYLRQAIATHAALRPPSLNLSPPGPLDTMPLQVRSFPLERYIDRNVLENSPISIAQ